MPEPEIKSLGVLNRTPSLLEISQDSNFQNPKLPIRFKIPTYVTFLNPCHSLSISHCTKHS